MNRQDRKNKKNQQGNAPVEESTEAQTSVVEDKTETETAPTNNFAEVGDKIEATGGEIVPPVEPVTTAKRGVIPDQFGNNVKGERICSVCGVKESETLAKNPRYSFCKGKCVNCYGKTERKTTKPSELTEEQLREKIAYYTDLLQKKTVGAQGLPQRSATENVAANTDAAAAVTSGATVDDKVDASEELAAVSK